VAEAMADPQVRHRELVARVGGLPVGPGPAIKLPDAGRGPLRPAPGLGEHTGEVLAAAGLSASEIDSLRARGVV
jgi:crotonobetainyl-CoA:carnitine CoA-transferase CaiB-like acyl-CoA transferase